MNCLNCLRNPEFLCHCKNVFLCSLHLGEHMRLSANHVNELLKLPSHSEKLLALQLIKILLELKETITSQSKDLINFIEQKSNLLHNQLDKQLSSLLKGRFSEAELINLTVMSTSIIKPLNLKSSNIYEMIEKKYSKNPFKIITNSSKKAYIKTNKFLKNHNAEFTSLAISSDGKTLISGSSDSTVRVWDVDKRVQTFCFVKHMSVVNCVNISKTSSFAVSGSDDKTVILWDFNKGCLVKKFKEHAGSVIIVEFSWDNSFIVSGSSQNEICVWDLSSYQLMNKIVTRGSLLCGVMTSKNRFYSGTGSNIEYWDLINSNKTSFIENDSGDICSISLSNKGNLIATGDFMHKIKIWDEENQYQTALFEFHAKLITSVCFTTNDNLLISSSEDQNIIIWDINNLQLLHQFQIHNLAITQSISMNDLIFSASHDKKIGISRISSKTNESYLNLETFNLLSENSEANLISFGVLDRVYIWNYLTNENKELVQLGGYVKATCISSSLDLLICASEGYSHNLILWDLNSMQSKAWLYGHYASVRCVDLADDGSSAISGDENGSVIVWEFISFESKWLFQSHSGKVNSVKFNKRGNLAASGGEDQSFDLES